MFSMYDYWSKTLQENNGQMRMRYSLSLKLTTRVTNTGLREFETAQFTLESQKTTYQGFTIQSYRKAIPKKYLKAYNSRIAPLEADQHFL